MAFFLGPPEDFRSQLGQAIGEPIGVSLGDRLSKMLGSRKPIMSQEGGVDPNEFAREVSRRDAVQKGAGQAWGKAFLANPQLSGKEQSDIRVHAANKGFDTYQKKREEAPGKRENYRATENSLKQSLNAVESGEVGGFDQNFLASALGEYGTPFLNAKGSQLDSASKKLLIDDISKITGQKNQWIERRMFQANPGLGKTAEANEVIIQSALADNQVKQLLLDAEDDLAARYQKAGIKPPEDFEKQVYDYVKPFAIQIENERDYKVQRAYEKEKGENYLNSRARVPSGTYLTAEKMSVLMKQTDNDPQKALKIAKGLGYKIPDKTLREKLGLGTEVSPQVPGMPPQGPVGNGGI